MGAALVALLAVAAGVALLARGGRDLERSRRGLEAPAYLEQVLDADPNPSDADEFAERLSRPFVERVIRPTVARFAGAIGTVTPRDHRARVLARLGQAGLDGTVRPDEVIAAQVAGSVVGGIVGVGLLAFDHASTGTGLTVLVLLVGLGLITPMVWLRRRVDRRIEGIRRDLPETLDLLAISVEAGLGLERAMEVVVQQDAGPLAGELSRTLQEMELGLSRRDALANLKARAQVSELSTFVQALVQADILGMPLARVLKVQADEMRTKRRQWAREAAGKLPVKIMFPLVACIFPAVLVVVLGPAMSQIGQAF